MIIMMSPEIRKIVLRRNGQRLCSMFRFKGKLTMRRSEACKFVIRTGDVAVIHYNNGAVEKVVQRAREKKNL